MRSAARACGTSSRPRLLLAAAIVALLISASAAATAADCADYADFPIPRDGERCFFSNACYATVLCCPAAAAADDACIDVTSFSCDVAAACAGMEASSATGAASLYARAINGGAAVQCCRTDMQTTPAPNVPSLGGPDEPSSQSDGSDGSGGGAAPPEPVDAGCGESLACGPNTAFAKVIRTLCPSLPAVFDDGLLNANLGAMCCWFENNATPAATQRDWGCGGDLLDLPLAATFHCNFDLRGTQHCCNGRTDVPVVVSSSSSSSSTARKSGVNNVAGEDLITSRASVVYLYQGDRCTDRIITPGDDGGNAAAMIASRTAVYMALLCLAAALTVAC